MRLISFIGLLFYGWAEMLAFSFVSNKVGGLLTLFGVFLTAIIGIYLLKNQGLSVLKGMGRDMSKGHTPVTHIADSVSLVIGGLLMLIPGYVTDGVGLLLFIPGFRTIAGVSLLQWIGQNRRFFSFVNRSDNSYTQKNGPFSGMGDKHGLFEFAERHHHSDESDDIIEGEFEERPLSTPKVQHEKKKEI